MVATMPDQPSKRPMEEVPGYTLSQISRAVGVNNETLRQKIVNGLIRGHKLGNTYVVTAAEVQRIFPGLKIG